MALGMLGKYERLDVLGRGVSGIVYLAKDTLLNKQVALKEVDVQAGDLRRFLEEARVMDRLRHPNIVRVNGVDRIEDKVVIDMEYVRGQNLQEVLRTEGAFTLDRALDITAQILDALQYAHTMQTVHRDIKPANILLTRDGTAKLADFGLAEILTTNAYAGGAGTYAYMAPEDFAEENHSDSQSDIWAVGITLFEMLTGERPFCVANPKSPFAWKRTLENDAPRPLSDFLPEVSPLLQAVLDRALACDKSRRYQTAGEFRNDLLRLRAGEGLAADTLRLRNEAVTRRLEATLPSREASVTARFGYDIVTPTSSEEDSSPPRSAGKPKRPAPTVLSDPDEPGTIVANVLTEAVPAISEARPKRARLPFLRKGVARLMVDPDHVEFGELRKGETRVVKLQAKVTNLEGSVGGRVLHTPNWISVYPPAFERSKQVLTLTAHSERAWETGEFQDYIRIETNAGATDVPVHVTVRKPRPMFRQVAAWFVPLFGCALLPAAITAAFGTRNAVLAPPAATASLLLALMLLLIGVAADVGMGERLACGIVMAAMCFVLGIEAAAAHQNGYNTQLESGLHAAGVIGFGLGLVVLAQFLIPARWKFWGFILACMGLTLGSVFFHIAVS